MDVIRNEQWIGTKSELWCLDCTRATHNKQRRQQQQCFGKEWFSTEIGHDPKARESSDQVRCRSCFYNNWSDSEIIFVRAENFWLRCWITFKYNREMKFRLDCQHTRSAHQIAIIHQITTQKSTQAKHWKREKRQMFSCHLLTAGNGLRAF